MLLKAYSLGIFPMAEGRGDQQIYWVDPEERGILPLECFHLPHTVRKLLRQNIFRLTVNRAFSQVIAACAAVRPGRRDTWINHGIQELCEKLHRMGHAYSIETWLDDRLAGGLYGIALGGAFFGESMFSEASGASQCALSELVARLRRGGFQLLDTQFVTPHLKRFGAVEIRRSRYRILLDDALRTPAQFPVESGEFWKDLVVPSGQSKTIRS
jgi:leucyl/phenylalanyl-tRNA--protein transferase